MDAAAYPLGTVLKLIDSDLVTPPTRRALKARLQLPQVEAPRFFDDQAYAMLGAVCARLIPQRERRAAVDLPGLLDARLADGDGDGWRYATMPRGAVMHEYGLMGLEQTAEATFGSSFVRLSGDAQDAVLRAVQSGGAVGAVWSLMEPARYFEELLAQLVDIYYAQPLALESIGYAGMADARGWQAIGLDQRDAHEPAPLAALEGAA